MTTPATANFKIKTNGTWTQTWQITNGGVPIDISNYTFEVCIRAARGPKAKVYMTLSVGSGITISDAANGKITIEIPPMPLIQHTTVTFYDLLAIVNGKGTVWIEGKMTLDPGTSYQGD
jgi:hypothetical protein